MLETVISKGPHALACTPDMTTFIQGEIQISIKDGFRILLPAADTVRIFGNKLNLSYIAEVPQSDRRPRLILNLSGKLDVGMPSSNDTSNKEVAPELLQFGRSFPCILQAV